MKNEHGGILLCAAVFLHGVRVVVDLGLTKRNGGSDFLKAAVSNGRVKSSAVRRLFSFAVVRQMMLLSIISF